MKNTETSISNLIEQLATCADHQYDALFLNFLNEFRCSELGIDIKEGDGGENISTNDDNPDYLPVAYCDGKMMIVTFADTQTLARNFGTKLNAKILGNEALVAALRMPGCEGVVVNSALSQLHVKIQRQAIESLLGEKGLPTHISKTPWWMFWQE